MLIKNFTEAVFLKFQQEQELALIVECQTTNNQFQRMEQNLLKMDNFSS